MFDFANLFMIQVPELQAHTNPFGNKKYIFFYQEQQALKQLTRKNVFNIVYFKEILKIDILNLEGYKEAYWIFYFSFSFIEH